MDARLRSRTFLYQIMKRTFRSALFATSAIVLAGGLLYFGAPKGRVSVVTNEVQSVLEPMVDQLKEVLAPVETAAVRMTEDVAGFVKGSSAQQSGSPVVLLSEPVIILGDSFGREALPKGTPVRVLKNQGSYVQVQHASRVITIPRTAMVFGAYRPN
jgi:hypothetical protein